MKTVFAIISAVLLVVGLAVGAWYLGWFVQEKNVEKQVHIDNKNLGTQTAWHDQAVQNIKDYDLTDPGNTAARGVLRTQACQLIARLSEPYRDDIIVSFQSTECT